jgi:hypothetical protein
MTEPRTDHPSGEQLQAFLDGELEAQAEAWVAAHTRACTVCGSRLEQLRGLFARIESVPELELGVDLSPLILSALPRGRGRLPLLAALEAAAAAVLVALGLPWLAASGVTTEIARSAQQALDPWIADLASLLADLTAELGLAVDRLTAVSGWPSLPSIPAAQLWLLGGSAAALWVVGNGLLLRQTEIHREERS